MFYETSPDKLRVSPFELIGKNTFLLAAGTRESFNTMTAAWGALGVMWGKDTASVVVRPQRYTYEFMEKSDFFSMSFLGKEYKKALAFCGSHSGRDTDKCASAGITPVFEGAAVYFEEADLVVIAKKIYVGDVSPAGFTEPALCEKIYPGRDYHRLYVGEVVKILEKR